MTVSTQCPKNTDTTHIHRSGSKQCEKGQMDGSNIQNMQSHERFTEICHPHILSFRENTHSHLFKFTDMNAHPYTHNHRDRETHIHHLSQVTFYNKMNMM